MENFDWTKFLKNMMIFTAPALGIFFGQLAAGVDIKIAASVGLLALYGVLADFFAKYKKANQ